MAEKPSAPWTLRCPWCPWSVVVNARGQRGADEGSGVEAARLGERHATQHGRTWQQFLAAVDSEATSREELPTTRDLIGLVPDITGGVSAEEHVRRLRMSADSEARP